MPEFAVAQAHQDEPRREQPEEERLEGEVERVARERELEEEVLARQLDHAGVLQQGLAGLAQQEPRGQRQVRGDERRVQLRGPAHQADGVIAAARLGQQEAAPVEEPGLERQAGEVVARPVLQPGGQVVQVLGRRHGGQGGGGALRLQWWRARTRPRASSPR